jgi:thioredoxin-like negative regulator of GroEL
VTTTLGNAAPPIGRAAAAQRTEKPTLVFFRSERCGRSRQVESLLASVLQRRRNHDTFVFRHVDVTEQPRLAESFGVVETPTLVVIDGRAVAATLARPASLPVIERFLRPWLQ